MRSPFPLPPMKTANPEGAAPATIAGGPASRGPGGDAPEQRRQARVPVRTPLEFTIADPKNVTFGFVTDLSAGGAFVQTAFPAPLGRAVVLRVWRPGWHEEVLLQGVVRWVRADGADGMGVEFTAIGRREAWAIADLADGAAAPAPRAVAPAASARARPGADARRPMP
jgi:uncharacterized protein (TIGR02266 family)